MRQMKMAILLLMVAIPAIAFAGTSGPTPIPNPPNFQVSINTLVLCKGVVNYVPITVINSGNPSGAIGSITMEDLTLGLSSGKYLSLVANGSTTSRNLVSNSSATVVMPIFVSLNATTFVSSDVLVDYNYLGYYTDSEARNISFSTESCPSQLSVAISPKTLISGKIENVSFTLSNGGSTTIKDVSLRASLSPQQGQILSSQPVLISSIPPMESSTINETLFINSTSETFPVNASISFYNGTNLEQISDSIAVLSSGIINLTASSVTLSPTTPSVGGIFSISFVLTNLGTTSASAVTATILPPNGITAFGSNSVFIGGIGVNTQTPVTLTLSSAASTKSGSYVVPVQITYLNNLRQQISSTINVPVTIGGSSANAISGRGVIVTSGSGGTTYAYRRSSVAGEIIIIILAIAVVALAILLYREKKQHRKTKEAISHVKK
jgi:hypothetical protein